MEERGRRRVQGILGNVRGLAPRRRGPNHTVVYALFFRLLIDYGGQKHGDERPSFSGTSLRDWERGERHRLSHMETAWTAASL